MCPFTRLSVLLVAEGCISLSCAESDYASNETSERNIVMTISDADGIFPCRGSMGVYPDGASALKSRIYVACVGGGPQFGLELSEAESRSFFTGISVPDDGRLYIGYRNAQSDSVRRALRVMAANVDGAFQVTGTLAGIEVLNDVVVEGDDSRASMVTSGRWEFGCTADGVTLDVGMSTEFCRTAIELLEIEERYPSLLNSE